MNPRKTWLALFAALAVLAVVAAGCGGGDHTGAKKISSGSRTDAAFIADRTAHHQGAIDVAKLAEKQADHANIRRLADDNISAQRGEIATMKAVRDDMHSAGMHGAGHMGMSQHAMGIDMDMAALEKARPFDRAFVDAMVRHHEGAVAMAESEFAKGGQPALRKMAENIIGAQTKEIAQMKHWRKAWYGSATVPGEVGGHGSMNDMDMGG